MYAESGRMLREAMADLLGQHRVLQQISTHTRASSSPAEERARAAAGAMIARYRKSVLTWCAETSRAIDPYVELNVAPGPKNPFVHHDRELNPLTELQETLFRALNQDNADLPDLELLTTPQPQPYVETWRIAARAAALAEHDLSGRAGEQSLSVPQAQTVMADIGAITQALIMLDRRSSNIPGWQPLHGVDRLGWAALAASLDAGLGRPDLTVDRQGWRAPVKLIRGPAKPGALGVLQAEHNLYVRLHTLPTATNLRLIVDSQRLLSREIAPHAKRVDPNLGATWYRRAETYARLLADLRDIGGVLGRGQQAVEEAVYALHRLRALPDDTLISARTLAALHATFNRIDTRLADTIEDAVRAGTYLKRRHLERHATRKRQRTALTKGPFVRAEQMDDVPAIRTVRDRLRPHEAPASVVSDPSRAHLAAAIASPLGRRDRAVEAPGL